MQITIVLLLASALVPLWQAWWANRHTTLLPTVNAGIVAWGGWLLVLYAEMQGWGNLAMLRYLALCLTATVGIAVLGARRPGVAAWNLVLAGLLAVMMLPVAECAVTGKPLQLELPRTLFLAGTLGMIVLNYLPTRLGLAALLLTVSAALVLARFNEHEKNGLLAAYAGLGLAPWLGLLLMRSRPRPASQFDLLWLEFRDRFGLLWSQRLREQFNRAVENAGWPAVLRWHGLRLTQPDASLAPIADELLATLRAILKRFEPEEEVTQR